MTRARTGLVVAGLWIWYRLPVAALAVVYRATIGLAVRFLRSDGVTIYTRGGFGRGDAVLGLSDIDVVAVVTDSDLALATRSKARLERRFDLMRRWIPTVRLLVDLDIFKHSHIEASATGPSQVFGLVNGKAAHFGPDPIPFELLVHPAMPAAAAGWLIRDGGEERSQLEHWDDTRRAHVGWLELQHIWRTATQLVLDPGRRDGHYRALRIVTDSTRVWGYLATGVHVSDRQDVLTRVVPDLRERQSLPPDGERVVSEALRINRNPRAGIGKPIDATVWLDWLFAITGLVAETVTSSLASAPLTSVRLTTCSRGDGYELADWRSVVSPMERSQGWQVRDGSPRDVRAVAEAARAQTPGRYVALCEAGLIVKPTSTGWADALWRPVHFPVSDPVSFAQVGGRTHATFVDAEGWSAVHLAQRAINEHRAYLAMLGPDTDIGQVGATRLLTAARAAQFSRSLVSGDPELCVDLDAVVQAMANDPSTNWLDGHDSESVVASGYDGDAPDEVLTSRLLGDVKSLPEFS